MDRERPLNECTAYALHDRLYQNIKAVTQKFRFRASSPPLPKHFNSVKLALKAFPRA